MIKITFILKYNDNFSYLLLLLLIKIILKIDKNFLYSKNHVFW